MCREKGSPAPNHLTNEPFTLLHVFEKRAYCHLQVAKRATSSEMTAASVDRLADDFEVADFFQLLDENELSHGFKTYLMQAIALKKDREFLPSHILQQEQRLLQSRQTAVPKKASGKNQRGKKKQAAPFLAISEALVSCETIIDAKIAFNALQADDGCSICLKPWNEFPSPSFAIVLKCSHATCAGCLVGLAQTASSIENDTRLCCPECRAHVDDQSLKAVVVLAIECIESIQAFKSLIVVADFTQLALELVYAFQFDLKRVAAALFNFASLLLLPPKSAEAKDLTHNQKQLIYHQARAPVDLLEKLLAGAESRLPASASFQGWIQAQQDIMKISRDLELAKKAAATDIYQQLNAIGSLKETADGIVKIDLHGLTPSQAKKQIRTFIIPVLSVVKEMRLITGYGRHSLDGESALKKAVIDYLSKPGISTCKVSPKNAGELVLLSVAA